MIDMKRLTALLLLLGTCLAMQAATPPPEKLLPADTLAVLTVPDYAKARASTANVPASLLWADPAMKPFRDKLMGKLNSDVIAPLEREFGIKFSDYASLAQGQVTIAITQSGWEGKPGQEPRFVLILDAKDKSDQLKTNLATLKKKWVDSGKQLRSEKIRDREFTTLIFMSDELSKTFNKVFPNPDEGYETREAPKPKKAPTKLEWTLGQSDSLLILSDSAQEVEKVLVRQAGGAAPTLSEQATFASSYGTYFRDSLGYGWVNLKTFVDIVVKSAGDSGKPGSMNMEKIIKAVGLTAVENLSFNLQNSDEGAFVHFFLKVPEAGRQGIFKLISFERKDASVPSFVPADAVKFGRYRLDLQKVFATIETTLDQIEPQYANLLKTMIDLAGKDKDPDFDLRKQLIANLGDDIISYEKLPRKQTVEDLESPPSLFLFSSPKPEQLASAIKAIASFLPSASSAPKLKERDFLGRKVFSLTMNAMTKDGTRKNKSYHYSASGGYVVVSSDVSMLEEYLRGNSGKSLAETPGFAEAAQKVGGMGTGLFCYENQRETTRAALEILKKDSGNVANLFSSSPFAGRLGIGEDGGKFKEWIDFSLLPPFDQIAKYFYLSVWSGNMTADGMQIKIFTPVSPQLRAK